MPNIPRAPLWVPRPADDAGWNPSSRSAFAVTAPTSPSVSIARAPFWAPRTNDLPEWASTPRRIAGLYVSSAVVGGIARAPFWVPRPDDIGDSYSWRIQFNGLLQPSVAAPSVPPQWLPQSTDESWWAWSPVNSTIAFPLSPVPVVPIAWPTIDDPSDWAPALRGNPNLQTTPPQGPPFTARNPFYYGEDTYWTGTPQPGLVNLFPVPAPGPLGSGQSTGQIWYVNAQDASDDSSWLASPISAISLYVIPAPPSLGEFTVSGPTVEDLFGPVTGVSYTWSPTQMRTV